MKTTSGLLNQMVDQVNLKLEEMEKGHCIELNGRILELVKGNERYCLLVESDMHKMFTFLMHIDDFIYGLVKLNESGK